MRHELHLPAQLNHETVAVLLQEIEAVIQNSQNKEMVFNASHSQFIDPIAMTILFNELAYIKAQGWQTYINQHTHNDKLKKTIQYLDDCGFFFVMSGKQLAAESACRTTSLPIKWLKPSETFAYIQYQVIKWLAQHLAVSENSLIEIRICLEELLNNTRDHAGVEFASLFVQYFPSLGQFKICISDNGIGLIQKIQQTHPAFSAQQCIEQALKEGFSTKSSPRNAGMGLFTLTQTVCHNGGDFVIRAGHIHAQITANGIKYSQSSRLKGTAFEITLHKTQLNIRAADMEDFTWD